MKKSAIARNAPTSTASRAGVEMRRCPRLRAPRARQAAGRGAGRTSVAVMRPLCGGPVAGYQSVVILVPAYLVTPSYAGHTGAHGRPPRRADQPPPTVQAARPPTVSPTRATSPRHVGPSWPASCAAAASGSPRRTSGSPPPAGGARPACAARRSPSSPGWGSPGTPGSSRAATSPRRPRCWTRSPARCGWTAHERTHLFRLADVPDPSSPDSCTVLPDSTQLLLDRLDPYPAWW